MELAENSVMETEKTTPRGRPEISCEVRHRSPFRIAVAIALSHLSSSQSITDRVCLVAARAVVSFVFGGAASSTEVTRAGKRFHNSDDRGVTTAFVLESRCVMP
ncbi:hypothetical protein TIFTF001_016989 [Ficus carica]|uniref:Uncharacterized protein n=1 Tax=Ficus carica TaxID=3494 RepID=A0AA88A797_FICCA|nr:hypothetical protein TIFTF001_016989 [Ficus carica]